MASTPGDLVLDALQSYKLKQGRGGEWRCNSPFRAGSDSGAFSLKLTDDRMWGVYYDHAHKESGTLRDLITGLHINYDWPPLHQAEQTKRGYDGLEDYARAHGVPGSVLSKNGWSETVYLGKRALAFKTKNGTRYRYLEGGQSYDSPSGYERCFYGLQRAVKMVADGDAMFLVMVNGECSALVGQHYGLATFCMTGGEKSSIPDVLMDQLADAYPEGYVALAFDSDYAGGDAMIGLIEQFHRVGRPTYYLDLGFDKGGDIVDFCRLYGADVGLQVYAKAREGKIAQKPTGFVTFGDAIAQAQGQLNGEIDTQLPLPMYWQNIVQYGGLADLILPGMIICLAGDSGMGKTSVLESMIDPWRMAGWHGAGWGPEWTPTYQAMRAIQRNGGASVMDQVRHTGYLNAVKKGYTPEQAGKMRLKLMDDALKTKTDLVAAKIEAWPGTYDIVKGSFTIETIIDGFRQAIDAATEAGRHISFFCVDYAQLLECEDNKQNDQINRAIQKFKEFVISYQVVGIVTSQVTKASGSAALRGESHLGQHDLMMARVDKFNLLLALTREKDRLGRYSKTATVYVGKNSLGTNGEAKLILDEARLRWRDAPTKNETPDLILEPF